MNLSLKEEAREIMMPDWMPGSCRVRLHDMSAAGDIPGRVSAAHRTISAAIRPLPVPSAIRAGLPPVIFDDR